MRKTLILGALPLLTMLCSCQTAYMQNRKNDMLDCIKFSYGSPVGLHAGVKVTDFATLKLGYSTGIRKGYTGRHAGMWDETEVGLPLILGDRDIRSGGAVATVMGHTPDELEELTMFTVATKNDCWLNGGKGACEFRLRHWANLFDIELGGTLLMISGRIGLSPGQFLDFLCGFIGLDPAGDDTVR